MPNRKYYMTDRIHIYTALFGLEENWDLFYYPCSLM